MFKKLTLFSLPLLISACASGPHTLPEETTSRPAPQAEKAAQASSETPAQTKTTPLSSEMLYRLMTAEIAGQRGQLGVVLQ